MSKKATKNTKDISQYEVGQAVLGKVRGYPPWPGMVVDPTDVPPAVLAEQPPGKKTIFYCVLFFPMGDYAWLHSKDISTLKKHEMESYLADDTKKKTSDLREGYRIAMDPNPWHENLMRERAAALKYLEELDENAEVDELQSEPAGDDDDDSKPAAKAKAGPTKKRKRDSEAEPAKTRKAPKAKKEPAEPSKKKSSAPPKPRKNGAKSKAMIESEDEGDDEDASVEKDDAGPSHKASPPPPAKKAKRDKDDDGDDSKLANDPQSAKVREWRHKLQKTFLGTKTLPKLEDMAAVDELFTTVENYDGMTIEQLQFSKIGKVMRHIAALTQDRIPRDDEFKFRARAKGLVDTWHQILNANKQTNGSPATSAANGKSEKKEKAKSKSKDEDEVTEGARNIDLNGRAEATPDAAGEEQEMAAGDMSMLTVGDVTMDEA